MSILAFLLAAATPATAASPAVPTVVTRSGLRLETLEAGSGSRPTRTSAVLVRYEVRLVDGTIVDAPAGPAGLRVAEVIPGLREALLLMNQGGRYRVRIPPKLAYGARGSADRSVPPNAELIFTIALLKVGREAQPSAH
jgi:FKBP-type peptidyl-prolyl cis-trans isomerase